MDNQSKNGTGGRAPRPSKKLIFQKENDGERTPKSIFCRMTSKEPELKKRNFVFVFTVDSAEAAFGENGENGAERARGRARKTFRRNKKTVSKT